MNFEEGIEIKEVKGNENRRALRQETVLRTHAQWKPKVICGKQYLRNSDTCHSGKKQIIDLCSSAGFQSWLHKRKVEIPW